MSNKTQIATLLADNTTGAITPKDVRDALDIVDTEQNLPANVLKADGTVSMDAGYAPTNDGDIATKKYVEKAAPFAVSAESGIITKGQKPLAGGKMPIVEGIVIGTHFRPPAKLAGRGAVVLGGASSAPGEYSFAIGSQVNAVSNNSFIFGANSSTHKPSTVHGNLRFLFLLGADLEGISSIHTQVIIGSLNKRVTDKSFVIGNGHENKTTGADTRENSLEISLGGIVNLPQTTIAEVAKDPKNAATVEYVKSLVNKGLPAHPTADGEYKLKVAAGVATWVKI